jgi:hypothetical protein
MRTPGAGSGERIGRSSGGKISGEKRRPADAVVDEVRGRLALQKLTIRRHQPGTNGEALFEVLLVPKRIEPSDRPGFKIGDGENVAEIGRTEKRPVGDEAVGVEFSPVPAHELLQIEIELRLKNSDPDGAGPDSAADIGEKVVGVVERDGDAVAVEIGPQPTPIAGQGGGGRNRGRRFRPVVLRQGGRVASRSQAGKGQRGRSEGPRPTTSGDCHLPRPRSDLDASFRCESGKIV